jgi:SAM-dependent methyltransferase
VTASLRAALHQQRLVAESFGTEAERYDRARPCYPAALVDRLVAASRGREILDVGTGTGIAARLFASGGCRVQGVEPDARMAEIARARGIEVHVAKFEDWDAAGRQFDAVISAQAWHWVDPVAGAVKAASVLRPAGRLAVFWNVFDPAPELRAAFDGVYRRVLAGSPINDLWSLPTATAHQVMSGTAVRGIERAGVFGPPEQWQFDWSRLYTREEWLTLVLSLSGHGEFPPAVLTELLTGLGADIDPAGGTFTMRYATVAVTAVVAGAGRQ